MTKVEKNLICLNIFILFMDSKKEDLTHKIDPIKKISKQNCMLLF